MNLSQLSSSELLQRKMVGDRMMTAFTLQEVNEAKIALQRWREAHPDDLQILQTGEVLLNAEDFAREREEQRIALGLSEEEGLLRDRVLMQTFRCHSLLEVQQARRDLEAWLTRCPEDRVNADEYWRALDRAESLYREVDTWVAEAEAKGVALNEGVNARPVTA